MFNELVVTGISGSIFGLISFVLAYIILKIFKVESPFSPRVFPYVLGVVTFLVFFLWFSGFGGSAASTLRMMSGQFGD